MTELGVKEGGERAVNSLSGESGCIKSGLKFQSQNSGEMRVWKQMSLQEITHMLKRVKQV